MEILLAFRDVILTSGVSVAQGSLSYGRRVSTASAFLRPVMHRNNLHVATNAEVTKVRMQI